MLPDLTVLLALLLGLSSLFGAPADPWLTVLGTVGSVALALLMARATSVRGQLALAEGGEAALAEAALRWISTWALLGWFGCLFTFDWGAWVNAFVPRTLWLGRVAVLLLPAFVLWGGAWWLRAPLEAGLARRRGALTPPPVGWPAVVRGLRRNAVAFLPLFVILGAIEGVWVLGALGVAPLAVAARWIEAMELLNLGAVIAVVLLTLPLVPWLMARMLRARPLPPGRLRALLERGAASLGLRYREILLWPTGGRVYNAMVVGVTNRSRRIFFTDALLGALSEDEILAVFFHEAGHARRRHLELYLLLFFALALLLHAASGPLAALGIPPFLVLAAHLALIWFVLLGSVSRRFEREADVFGARHASFLDPEAPPVPYPGLPVLLPRGTALMMSALDRLRHILGPMPSHRHGTPESRIGFLASLATNPETRRRWRRELRRLRGAIVATVAAALVATALVLPGEAAVARAQLAIDDGHAAYDRAFDLEHPRTHPEADHPVESPEARRLWETAHAAFSRAAAELEGQRGERERLLRLVTLADRADTALHGLRDEERARAEFTEVLAFAEGLDADHSLVAQVRFQALIELGRLAAWRLDRGGAEATAALAEAERRLAEAQDLRIVRLADDPGIPPGRRSWMQERVNLLRATLRYRLAAQDPEAASERRVARTLLEELARGPQPGPEWVELRDDARRELRR